MEGYTMRAIYDEAEEHWTLEFNGGVSELPTHGPTLVVKQKGNTEFARCFVIALIDLYDRANNSMEDQEERDSSQSAVPESDPQITWRDWLAYFRVNYEWVLTEYGPDQVRVRPRAGDLEDNEELNYRNAVQEMVRLRSSKHHPNYYDPGRLDHPLESNDITTEMAAVDGFLVDLNPEFQIPKGKTKASNKGARELPAPHSGTTNVVTITPKTPES